MEYSLTHLTDDNLKIWAVLILVLMEKTNTQSQRAEGSFYLSANVGNKSGKRNICGDFGAIKGGHQRRMGLLLELPGSHVPNGVTS